MGYISDLRRIVGHRPLMVTAATGIIYDREKGLLLEKRSDNGLWCVPGGAIELGESLEEALTREVREETGLQIANPRFFDVRAGVHMVYPNGDEVYYTDVVYIVTEFTGELSHDAESTALQWTPLNALPEIMPTQTEYVHKFISTLRD